MDAYVSERRNTVAAAAFFARAIAETGVTPERMVTDKAACYPPAPRRLLPAAESAAPKDLNNGLERDHGHPSRGSARCAASSS